MPRSSFDDRPLSVRTEVEVDDGYYPLTEDRTAPFTPAELSTPPPPREFVVPYWIPKRDRFTLMSGTAGQGKTTLTVHLAIARALGLPWLSEEPVDTGGTVILTTEDAKAEYLRKIYAARLQLLDKVELVACLGGQQKIDQALSKRIRVFDATGAFVRLIVDQTGREFVVNTELIDHIAEVTRAQLSSEYDLMILETVARLAGGVEDVAGFSVLAEALQVLGQVCNVSMLAVHHVGQEASRNRVIDQFAARGATSLDGACGSHLQVLRGDSKLFKERFPATVENPEKHLCVMHVKANGPMAPAAALRFGVRTWGEEIGESGAVLCPPQWIEHSVEQDHKEEAEGEALLQAIERHYKTQSTWPIFSKISGLPGAPRGRREHLNTLIRNMIAAGTLTSVQEKEGRVWRERIQLTRSPRRDPLKESESGIASAHGAPCALAQRGPGHTPRGSATPSDVIPTDGQRILKKIGGHLKLVSGRSNEAKSIDQA